VLKQYFMTTISYYPRQFGKKAAAKKWWYNGRERLFLAMQSNLKVKTILVLSPMLWC
jgi:hypothetical protein